MSLAVDGLAQILVAIAHALLSMNQFQYLKVMSSDHHDLDVILSLTANFVQ